MLLVIPLCCLLLSEGARIEFLGVVFVAVCGLLLGQNLTNSEDPVNHVSNFYAYRSRRGPMVPPQSFIPRLLPEISATAELSETPCGGRPVPRKRGTRSKTDLW